MQKGERTRKGGYIAVQEERWRAFDGCCCCRAFLTKRFHCAPVELTFAALGGLDDDPNRKK